MPIAYASGQLSVRVRIRQSESIPGPKLECDAVVGGVHCLLAPQQLHILVEMANSIREGKGKLILKPYIMWLSVQYMYSFVY